MDKIIEVECPVCHSILWIDVEKKIVVQHKKPTKKNFKSFDELLIKEKEKKEKVDEFFDMAKKLEEAKKKKARELFEKSINKDKE